MKATTHLRLFFLSTLLAACGDDNISEADGSADGTGTETVGTADTTVTSSTTTGTTTATTTTGATGDTGSTDATASATDTSASATDTTATDTTATDTTATDSGSTSMSTDSTGSTSDMTTGGMTTGDMTTGGMTTGDMTTGGMTTGDMTTGGMTTGDMTTGGMTTGAMTGGMTGGMTTGGMTTGGEGCQITMCGNQLYECGDCIDNDGDNEIDAPLDPECISPCDDDEDSFATGIPGDNMDPCKQDCFFDGNSGAGDDGCDWDLSCDPQNPGGDDCPYDPNNNNCPAMFPQMCIDNCQVPNGCDCLGCCTVEVNGMEYDIYLAGNCNIQNIMDCPMCTKQESCENPCDEEQCEVCFGQDLPPECEEPTCPMGETPCEVNADCPANNYCQTGCCVPIEV